MFFKGVKEINGVMFLHILNGLMTFTFAILLSSLSLYLTKLIGLSQTESNSIVGFFLATNFLVHLISGFIGDRWLSNRALLSIAVLLETIGVFILSNWVDYLYLGLSFFLCGCGLSTTCINCLLTQQFRQDEALAREKAFFYNYAAMNMGFFVGFLFSGFVDMHNGYAQIFKISNVINLLIVYIIYKSWVHFDYKSNGKNHELNKSKGVFSVNIILIMIPILYMGFHYSYIANYLLLCLGILAISYIFFLGLLIKNKEDKNKIYIYLILLVSSIIFWMLHFIGPMGMTYFIKYNVQLDFFGYHFPPQWFMNLNSIFIILGSPLLVTILSKLRKKITISVTKQFILSLIFMSLSYFVLNIGIINANEMGLVSGVWIIYYFIFQSLGELLIAPVGYAMIGQLGSKKLQGIMMGLWMMGSGIAVTLSYYFSNIMVQTDSLVPLITNHYYENAFNQLGLWALGSSIVLLLCLPMIEKNIKVKVGKELELVDDMG